MISPCPIDGSPRTVAFETRMLSRHRAMMVTCDACGFLQAHDPSWLEDAYADAIVAADTGLVQRNLDIARTLSVFLDDQFGDGARFIDLAGGHGLLTRLMRDIGFDYWWHDPYAANHLAPGFDAPLDGEHYDAASAIEVLEHLTDPVGFLRDAIESTGATTIVTTTVLFEGSPPPPDWWYYTFDLGQHISFYQRRTLDAIAERVGLRCISDADLHVFTSRDVRPRDLRRARGRSGPRRADRVRRRMETRIQSDHRRMLDRARNQAVEQPRHGGE